MAWDTFRLQTRLSLSSNIIEEFYSLIAEIDAVKNSWIVTTHLLPQTLERITKSVIVTSTGASNRIEGNRLTDDEVEDLYKGLRVKKFKTRDEQEIVGYLECLEFIFKSYEGIPLSQSSILHLHQEMLRVSEKDAGHRGKYKCGSNRVEAKDPSGNVVGVIFEPTPPYLVTKEMQELVDWYHWASAQHAKHPLILIGNFIFEYLAIHPFQDGNGRTSRLITNLMLLQQGYLFTKVTSHEQIIEERKIDYYLALNKTQQTWKTENEDISAWLLFFLRAMKEQSARFMRLMQQDTIEYLLSQKQLALWEWANERGTEFARKDATQALGFPQRTVEEIIKKLVHMKRLERLGEGKATRYRLARKTNP
ncbi:MAG: Fic family protein [Candidatus Puniceispirillum sp.]|nr:Fic family protein [Candidatus Puniceispirillum sp.]